MDTPASFLDTIGIGTEPGVPANAVIVMYHGVPERIDDPYLDRWSVPADRFRAELDAMARHYDFVSIEEVVARSRSGRGRAKAVLTFDDAFENVYTNAFPVLRRRGIPFAVAIPSGLPDTGRSIWGLEIDAIVLGLPNDRLQLRSPGAGRSKPLQLSGRRSRMHAIAVARSMAAEDPAGPLAFTSRLRTQIGEDLAAELISRRPQLRIASSAQLKEMLDAGMTPVCHGQLHEPLAGKPVQVLEREIDQAKAQLRSMLPGEAIDVFAFAHGSRDGNADRHVEAAGFRYALITGNRPLHPQAGPLALPRVHSKPAVGPAMLQG